MKYKYLLLLLLTSTVNAEQLDIFSHSAEQKQSYEPLLATPGSSVTTSPQLRQAKVGDELVGIADYRIVVTQRTEHPNGIISLVGEIDGGYQATITSGNTGAYATVHTPEGIYNIEITANGERLYTPEDNRQFRRLPDQEAIVPPHEDHYEDHLPPIEYNQQLEESNTDVTIDVLVLWDATFADFTADSKQQTLIQTLMNDANKNFKDSGIYIHLNLVYSGYLSISPFSDTSDQLSNEDMLSVLRTNKEVAELRQKYKADLVGLVRQAFDPNPDDDTITCGVAYRLGKDGKIENSARDHAFFVVMTGRVVVTGGTAICRNSVFAHEVGHNLGASHDRATNNDLTKDADSVSVFLYSYGFGEKDTDSKYGTIMSYSEEETLLFSSPSLMCNRVVKDAPEKDCGRHDYADVVKTFNALRHAVANFDTDENAQDTNSKPKAASASIASSFQPVWLLFLLLTAGICALARVVQRVRRNRCVETMD